MTIKTKQYLIFFALLLTSVGFKVVVWVTNSDVFNWIAIGCFVVTILYGLKIRDIEK